MKKWAAGLSPARKLLGIVFVVGLLLQLLLFFRGWISDDQAILLNLGLDFARHHHLSPVAKGTSGAGHIPGSLLQLLIGVPLFVFPYFKAPNVIVGVSHLIAALLLIDVLQKPLGIKCTVIFFGLYWLSPWRLYHAGFLWEPSFLYLPAALHLWACWRLRSQSAFLPSMIVGLVIVATFQIHASFVVLLLLTAILRARRLIRLHYPGLVTGCIVGGLTLLPTIVALAQGTLPPLAPQDGFIGRGLVFVFPALKSILYWIRFISLDAGGIIKNTVFFSGEWASRGPLEQISGLVIKSLYVLAVASVAICAVAVYAHFRQVWQDRKAHRENGRRWIGKYTFAALVAMFILACLNPVTTQGWHVVIIFHAACISGAFWLSQKWHSGKIVYQWIIIALIVLRIPLALVIGFGHPRYRVAPLEKSIGPALVTEDLIRILPPDPLGETAK